MNRLFVLGPFDDIELPTSRQSRHVFDFCFHNNNNNFFINKNVNIVCKWNYPPRHRPRIADLVFSLH